MKNLWNLDFRKKALATGTCHCCRPCGKRQERWPGHAYVWIWTKKDCIYLFQDWKHTVLRLLVLAFCFHLHSVGGFRAVTWVRSRQAIPPSAAAVIDCLGNGCYGNTSCKYLQVLALLPQASPFCTCLLKLNLHQSRCVVSYSSGQRVSTLFIHTLQKSRSEMTFRSHLVKLVKQPLPIHWKLRSTERHCGVSPCEKGLRKEINWLSIAVWKHRLNSVLLFLLLIGNEADRRAV